MNRKTFVHGLLAIAAAISVTGVAERSAANATSFVETRGPAQHARPGADKISRLIVKFKPASALGTLQTDGFERSMALNRIAATMGAHIGVDMTFARDMSGEAQVFNLAAPVTGEAAALMAASLSELPEVDYAVVDEKLYALFTPDDTEFGSQWHFADPASGDFGIDAERAWDVITGSKDIYVAVLDTGILKAHPDFAGRYTGGQDMVSSDPTDPDFTRDGNGRDTDPSDPGDYVSSAEATNVNSDYYRCGTRSSWHGSHVAGTIGAAGNNGEGVAGINWVSKIVPVRVLAKCGAGYTSDIVDGMRWAVGLTVPGTVRNPTPARVLNLSLGGPGPCTVRTFSNGQIDRNGEFYQLAVNDVLATGAVVVAAAGNENLNVTSSRPANCIGVVSVAATTRDGNRASYSNFGTRVTIAAPGGASPTVGAGIISTLNAGTTVPAAMNYGLEVGTSMAAPHVAGIVSLMLSQRAYLTTPRVIEILQNTSTDFPSRKQLHHQRLRYQASPTRLPQSHLSIRCRHSTTRFSCRLPARAAQHRRAAGSAVAR